MIPNKACAVVLSQFGILLFRHPLAGVQLVKGGIESGETPAQAVLRELQEEAGIDSATVISDLGCWDADHQGQVWSFHLCQVARPLADRWSHDTLDDHGHRFAFFWAPLDRLPLDECHPLFRDALEFAAKALQAQGDDVCERGTSAILELRPACVTDLPSIYQGELAYIRSWEPDHEAAWHAQLQRHLACWVDNFQRLTVALVDGQFAGYALWMPEQGKAVLCTLNVSPTHRRLGVGRALLDAYAHDAQAQGFRRLSLSVRPDNPARQMYERAGFVRTGVDAHHYLTYERQV